MRVDQSLSLRALSWPFKRPHAHACVCVCVCGGAGLLGEHMLPTLRHARAQLLKPHREGGRMVPAGATAYACACHTAELRARYSLSQEAETQLRRLYA